MNARPAEPQRAVMIKAVAEARLSNSRMKAIGRSRVRIVPGFMRRECLALFEAWAAPPVKKLY